MGNGNSTNGGDGRPNTFMDRIGGALENRLIAIFIAMVLGTGGGIAFVKTDPTIQKNAKELTKRVEALEIFQAQAHIHRAQATASVSRIREVERRCTLSEAGLASLREEITRMRQDHKEILSDIRDLLRERRS